MVLWYSSTQVSHQLQDRGQCPHTVWSLWRQRCSALHNERSQDGLEKLYIFMCYGFPGKQTDNHHHKVALQTNKKNRQPPSQGGSPELILELWQLTDWFTGNLGYQIWQQKTDNLLYFTYKSVMFWYIMLCWCILLWRLSVFISHMKVFELLEFHSHKFQPSVNAINQQVQLTG